MKCIKILPFLFLFFNTCHDFLDLVISLVLYYILFLLPVCVIVLTLYQECIDYIMYLVNTFEQKLIDRYIKGCI